MSTSAFALAVLATLILAGAAQAAGGQCSYGQRADGTCWTDLAGYWNTAEGGVQFRQDGNDFYALNPPPCAAGQQRNRDWYIAGRVEGATIIGTMWRCTEGKLVQNCNHPGSYKIPFSGTFTEQPSRFLGNRVIKVEYTMEHWEIPKCAKVKDEPKSEVLIWIGQQMPTPTPTPNDPSDYWKKQYQKYKDTEDKAVDKFFHQDQKPLVAPR